MQAIPYKASTNRACLKILIIMRRFDEINPIETVNQLTIEQIMEYLLSFVRNKVQVHDPALMHEAMVKLKFTSNIKDSSACITKYCTDVFQRLDTIGLKDFKKEKPK